MAAAASWFATTTMCGHNHRPPLPDSSIGILLGLPLPAIEMPYLGIYWRFVRFVCGLAMPEMVCFCCSSSKSSSLCMASYSAYPNSAAMLRFLEGGDTKMILAGRLLLLHLRSCSNFINFKYFFHFYTNVDKFKE